MKRRGFVNACAVTAALAISGAANAGSAGKWQDGQEVYGKVCGYCHEHGVGPVIRGRQLQPDYVRSVVRHGNRAMPAFRESEIDNAMLVQVADLVARSTAPAAQ